MSSLLSITQITQVSDVLRWHNTRALRKQSLSEHSYSVSLIAEKILDILIPESTLQTKYILLKYALLHDVDELCTGDIPSDAKNKIRNHYKTDEPFDFLVKEEMPEVYEFTKDIETNHLQIKYIVKFADIIEMILYAKSGAVHDVNRVVYHSNETLRIKKQEYRELFGDANMIEFEEFLMKEVYQLND